MGRQIAMKLHPLEAALILSCREMGHGELTIKVQDSLPTSGDKPIEKINFIAVAKKAGFLDDTK